MRRYPRFAGTDPAAAGGMVDEANAALTEIAGA